MRASAQIDFFLRDSLILLNHASYGITSRHVAARADQVRRELESDPTRYLGAELTARLRTQARDLATVLGLAPEATALCGNATSGAAAIIDSLPLPPESTVVAFDTEYSSISRAWERACARVGATLIRVPVALPFSGPDRLLARLDSLVQGSIAYLQMSLVSSSSAIRFPVPEFAAWAHRRGGRVILDAAHGPGHVRLAPYAWGVDAMFGTVHKWFPAQRPVGFLWLTDDLVKRVRPAEVSLTWDSDDLFERFCWPGTFDPVPRLTLDHAMAQWTYWDETGAHDECRRLADAAVELLTKVGAKPTATSDYMPPRMRAFVLKGVTVAQVKNLMATAGIGIWIGSGAGGQCILRIATHMYNDITDIETVADQLKGILAI